MKIHHINNIEQLNYFTSNFKRVVINSKYNNHFRRVYLLNRYTINIRANRCNIDNKVELLYWTFDELYKYTQFNIFPEFTRLPYSFKLSENKTKLISIINNYKYNNKNDYSDRKYIGKLLKYHTQPCMFSFSKNYITFTLYSIKKTGTLSHVNNKLNIAVHTPYAIYLNNTIPSFIIPNSVYDYCLINDKNFWDRFKIKLQVSNVANSL